jgi:2-amino-4-hydroxy-6-hydroxymethyldihydropteridine diphosphokinase
MEKRLRAVAGSCSRPRSKRQNSAKAWSNSVVRKTVYLSLGSNLGDREANLREAITRLSALGEVTKISSFYETEPVEFTEQPCFVNCAVEMKTEAMPRQLLSSLLSMEREMGRRRVQRKGPRLIDLDIVLFGDVVVQTSELTIPHPAMQERRFVLEPLEEIAPEVRHPVLNKTVRELLAELPQGEQLVRKTRNA